MRSGRLPEVPEVWWMRWLGDEAGQQRSDRSADDSRTETPITLLSWSGKIVHLPLFAHVGPYFLPKKDVADRYFSTYMDYVHPALMILHRETFTAQYHRAWFVRPPRRWLAVLNLVFAIGCCYNRFITNKGSGGDGSLNDLIFLNRACRLSLNENIFLEPTDLQQVQIETLAALYLVISGQTDRASTMASLALRSALTLGINIWPEDRRLQYGSKEARNRLWWSVYLLDHLIISMNGRVSSIGGGFNTTLLPIPYDENHSRPEVAHVGNPTPHMTWLKMTLFQTDEERRTSADGLATCEPSASVIFHCEVDLATITHNILNAVSSSQAPLEHPSFQNFRIINLSLSLDSWHAKLPQFCRFSESPQSDRLRLNGEPAQFFCGKVRLALGYYTSRIILYLPYFAMKCSRLPSHPKPQCCSRSSSRSRTSSMNTAAAINLITNNGDPVPSNNARSPSIRNACSARLLDGIVLTCLRSACSVVDIFPSSPDIKWVTIYTPLWSVRHYLMQATTVLLLGILYMNRSSALDSDRVSDSLIGGGVFDDGISRTRLLGLIHKAFQWLYTLSQLNPANKLAFGSYNTLTRRIVPALAFNT
ncbi:hypothetical protein ACMYSQ_011271 [Aspergillus niger]